MARRALARVVTRLLFHSAEARRTVEDLLSLPLAQCSTIIPHGNYIGIYPDDPARSKQFLEKYRIDSDDTLILFFGGLRGYKGISQLLAAFRTNADPRLKLIIAGKPFEQDLADEIQQAASEDSRIHPYLGHIPETDVGPLYAISDLAIVPFEKTLSSGSVILALSQGKAILLPEDARVLGLSNSQGILFYDQHQGLGPALDHLPDKAQLKAMGRNNLEFAKTLDWETIGKKIVAAYGLRSADQSA
jgi:glycosyltransferase involved in cell wall biosynthesis